MKSKQEQSNYHLSEQLWAGQVEGTISWGKKAFFTHTVNRKKTLLGNKWALLENKRAILVIKEHF